VPTDVPGISGVTVMPRGCYAAHTCVLTSTAGLQCWGFNGDGQLGIGSTTNSNVPVRVTGF